MANSTNVDPFDFSRYKDPLMKDKFHHIFCNALAHLATRNFVKLDAPVGDANCHARVVFVHLVDQSWLAYMNKVSTDQSNITQQANAFLETTRLKTLDKLKTPSEINSPMQSHPLWTSHAEAFANNCLTIQQAHLLALIHAMHEEQIFTRDEYGMPFSIRNKGLFTGDWPVMQQTYAILFEREWLRIVDDLVGDAPRHTVEGQMLALTTQTISQLRRRVNDGSELCCPCLAVGPIFPVLTRYAYRNGVKLVDTIVRFEILDGPDCHESRYGEPTLDIYVWEPDGQGSYRLSRDPSSEHASAVVVHTLYYCSFRKDSSAEGLSSPIREEYIEAFERADRAYQFDRYGLTHSMHTARADKLPTTMGQILQDICLEAEDGIFDATELTCDGYSLEPDPGDGSRPSLLQRWKFSQKFAVVDYNPALMTPSDLAKEPARRTTVAEPPHVIHIRLNKLKTVLQEASEMMMKFKQARGASFGPYVVRWGSCGMSVETREEAHAFLSLKSDAKRYAWMMERYPNNMAFAPVSARESWLKAQREQEKVGNRNGKARKAREKDRKVRPSGSRPVSLYDMPNGVVV